MKGKRRIVAFLLTLALVFSYMPALAFADDGAGAAEVKVKAAAAKAEASSNEQAKKRAMAGESGSVGENKIPEKIEYFGDNEYLPAKYDEDGEDWFKGFGTIGNKITVTFKDGTTETFECKKYEFPSEEGGTDWSWAYIKENEEPKVIKDPEEDSYYPENEVWFDYSVNGQTNEITISKEFEVYNPETEDYDYPVVSTTFEGKYMTELIYTGAELTYDPGENPKYTNINQEGAAFKVVYSDGSEKNFVSKAYAERVDEGETRYEYAFFADGEEVITGVDEDGYTYPVNDAGIYSESDKYDADKGIYVEYDYLTCYVPVKEKEYVKPVSAELALTDGYVATGLAGEKWVSGWQLYAPGNKIIINYSDDTSKEFAYAEKGNDVGFYFGDEEFYPYIELSKRVKKGTAEYSGKLNVEGAGYQVYKLPVSVKVKATKNYVYAVNKTYSYTGKSIAPTVVVKYWTGSKFKTMPKSWYTCKPAKKKSVGRYEYKVTLKKKYRKKYNSPIWGIWQIIPKTPVIKSVTKKGHDITVTWTKFTAAQRKTISGFVIEISSKNNFPDDGEYTNWIRVGNKAAAKYTVKGFDSGKYYVRVRSFLEKKNGYYFESKPSKTKTITIN